MRRALLAGLVALAAAGLMTVPAAAATQSPAHPVTHRWHTTTYRGLRLRGTWSEHGHDLAVKGRMRDRRRDGRWVRVQVQGRSAAGRRVAETDFFFNGGRRAYTTPPFAHTDDVGPRHAFVRACVMTSQHGKPRFCRSWHRLF